MKSQPTLNVQSPPEISQSLTFPPKPSRPCPLPDRGAETLPLVEPNALPINQHKAAARALFNPQPGLAHPSASNHTKHVSSSVTSPLSSPPKGTLRLLTFGLANTEEELLELCDNSKDGGACIYVEDYILKDTLHRLGEPHVDLVLDARNFPDPHRRKITSHPGFYPENMNRIVQNTEFKLYLEDISKKMAQSRYKTDGSTPRAAAANGDCRLLPRRLPLL